MGSGQAQAVDAAQGAMQQPQQQAAPAATPGICGYWMEHKQRHCSCAAKKGHAYCGNHLFLATRQGDERMPCPVDPRQCVAYRPPPCRMLRDATPRAGLAAAHA